LEDTQAGARQKRVASRLRIATANSFLLDPSQPEPATGKMLSISSWLAQIVDPQTINRAHAIRFCIQEDEHYCSIPPIHVDIHVEIHVAVARQSETLSRAPESRPGIGSGRLLPCPFCTAYPNR
jgi:hypothetical protein